MKKLKLDEYQAPNFKLPTVELFFELDEKETQIRNRMTFSEFSGGDLFLNGKDLKLHSVAVNEEPWSNYAIVDDGLELKDLPADPVIEIHCQIDPASNTSLDGLYMSSGRFFTQNEPEGFRRITFFPDRPDVMSSYSTQIIADKKKFPILLSNGDLIERKDLADGRQQVLWKDPHSKPCYLFALVAGDFAELKDSFVTASGRKVDLIFYSDQSRIAQCQFAMDSLKRAMKWDEVRFGREYDLDTYMVVVVDDFNGGAMENKGLNVFNTRCVLATPSMTTDAEFEKIEAVVGHEYFHNWTGNRVTLRDWFHLSLKEGLTVFRDQEFSSDLHSRGVVRVDTVQELWQRQFSEDAGPNAHAVRPTEALSVNNFFSSTIYEKGAEVIRMIFAMTGVDGFRKGMDLYFDSYDGCAVTIEEFVTCFEKTCQLDLAQFRRWYSTPGTPVVNVSRVNQEKILLRQSCKSIHGNSEHPLHIPIAYAELDQNGKIVNEGIIDLKSSEMEIDVPEKNTLSLLRGYSAPINLQQKLEPGQRQLLIEHETDTFQVWQQVQQLMIECSRSGETSPMQNSIEKLLAAKNHDDLFLANVITIPSVNAIAATLGQFDPDEIVNIQNDIARTLSKAVRSYLGDAMKGVQQHIGSDYDPKVAAERALQLKIIRYSIASHEAEAIDFAEEFIGGANATVFLSLAFSLINFIPEKSNSVLDRMRSRLVDDDFMMNKYYELAAVNPHPDSLQRIKREIDSEKFHWTNPNNVLFLIRDFANHNLKQFHEESGSGYNFLADSIIHLDPINSQTAARLCSGFSRLADLSGDRGQLMKAAMARIAQKSGISPNVLDLTQVALEVNRSNIGQSL